MNAFLQNLRYAARTLRRSPGVTLAVVFCLALGIGINATLFSVTAAISLRPFPFASLERLTVLYETNPGAGEEDVEPSFQNFRD